MQASIYFEQLDTVVDSFIRTARQELQVSVCWFSHPGIFRSVLQMAQRGVSVDLLLQYDQVNFHPNGLPFDQLSAAGVRIWGYTGPQLLHHKCAVADQQRILTGSYNWTRSRNADQVMIVDQSDLAVNYSAEFERIKKHARPLEKLQHTPPSTTHFTQLHTPVACTVTDMRKQVALGAKLWIAEFTAAEHPIWQTCLRQQIHLLRYKHTAFWEQNGQNWQPETFRNWLNQTKAPSYKPMLNQYGLVAQTGDIIIAVCEPGIVLGVGMIGGPPEYSAVPGFAYQRYVQWRTWPKSVTSHMIVDLAIWELQRPFRQFKGSGMQVIASLPEAP
jgi:mitochondrial cardiolipin hydrolase